MVVELGDVSTGACVVESVVQLVIRIVFSVEIWFFSLPDELVAFVDSPPEVVLAEPVVQVVVGMIDCATASNLGLTRKYRKEMLFSPLPTFKCINEVEFISTKSDVLGTTVNATETFKK
mmetsp:Transcript_18961/g.52177  ORF Transcript_18961/g.52177 Transcript_18961/m.52177 type:complete len:119 (+) Transcript_18961:244-600(+)